MALSNIVEVIERSLFQKLRLITVAEGYIPDVTLFPNDEIGITNYQAAVSDIVISKGFSIALFGVGSNQNKYIKTIPRIVIIERKFIPGDLGGSPAPSYQLNTGSGKYDGHVQPPQTSDYHFQVNITYYTAAQKRIMDAIVALVFNNRAYIPFYNDDTQFFFIERYNSSIIEDNNLGIKELIYLYKAMDIWESADTITPAAAVPITEITLETSVDNLTLPDKEVLTPTP